MPVARIVSHNVTHESPALARLIEQLRASGYEVEIAPQGSAGAADVVVEFQEVPLHQALDAAEQVARESNADVYVAPGIFASSKPQSRVVAEQPPAQTDSPLLPHSEPIELPAEDGSADIHPTTNRASLLGNTVEELGAALSDGRMGVRDTLSGVRARVADTWGDWQKRRADAVQQRRLERERREIEHEQRRQEHELELQRRAEERQQLLAQRERVAAEQERLVREQMARDAEGRAERERLDREAIAREAARRAEVARAQEQERLRLAAVEAERQRARREQESQAPVLAAAPPLPARLEAITRMPLPDSPAAAAPLLRPRLVHPARRLPTARERQWQRAAFVASIATLAAMLGFAIAGAISPSSPLPSSIMHNNAEQTVPFGAARIDASPARSPKPSNAPVVSGQTARAAASQKPSPTKPAARRRARRLNSDNDVAEDEVVVRHAPTTRNQRAQTQRGPTTAGVRRYSDEN